MKEYINILKKCLLFDDLTETEILNSLECLEYRTKIYKKDDIIFCTGDKISAIGLVLKGSVFVFKEDIMGNRVILSSIGESSIFGEAFIYSDVSYSPVNVVSSTNSEIIFLNFNNIIHTCKNNCSIHGVLVKNMLKVIANKNLLLNNKIEILSAKTTRDKLMAYFNLEMKQNNSNKFKTQYNREHLADFLNLNRSNMSRELSKMCEDNIIKYTKNTFEILI